MIYDKETKIKLLLLIALISAIFIVICLMLSSPARSYELSIYSQFSTYFWFLVLLSLVSSSIVVIFSSKAKLIHLGLGLIILVNTLIIALPIFRGYFVYSRGDIISHIGNIKEIVASGSVPSQNFYPGIHILSSNIALVTEIPFGLLFQLLSLVFYLFFICSIYVLFRYGFNYTRYKYLVLIGTLLIFGTSHINIIPNVMVFFFLPIILYLLIKVNTDKKVTSLSSIYFILTLYVIFSHPIASVYVLFIIILFSLFMYISQKKSFSTLITKLNRSTTRITIGLLSIWFFWYFLFPTIQHGFKNVIISLFYESDVNPALSSYTEGYSVYGVRLIDAAQIITFRFGLNLILLLVSIVVVFLFLLKSRKNFLLSLFDEKFTGFFIAGFGIFVLWSGINALAYFVTFTRVFKWFIFFSIFIIGVLMINPTYSGKKRYKTFVILICILIILSVFSVYPSPMSKSGNRQVPSEEYHGSDWIFENIGPNESYWQFGTSRRRMSHLIYGRYSVLERVHSMEEKNMPKHFGYSDHEQVGQNFSGYIIHTDLTRLLFEEVFTEYEENWFFNQTSYNKLNNDPSVDRIYDNGFYYTYQVREVDSE